MKHTTIYVAFDNSKDTLAVAQGNRTWTYSPVAN